MTKDDFERVGPPAEWSTTYRCKHCKGVLTINDDSDYAMHPELIHDHCDKADAQQQETP